MVGPCTEFEAGKYAASLRVALLSGRVGRHMSLLSINMNVPQGPRTPLRGGTLRQGRALADRPILSLPDGVSHEGAFMMLGLLYFIKLNLASDAELIAIPRRSANACT